MGIKLHYHPLSTYSRRVRIAFAEKQIARAHCRRYGGPPTSRTAIPVADPMAVYLR